MKKGRNMFLHGWLPSSLQLVELVLLLSSVIYESVAESGPIIIVPPVLTVGCYGGLSTFYCASNRSDVLTTQWQIDGNSLTNEITTLHEISTTSNISVELSFTHLTIIGKPINNNLVVGCIIATYSNNSGYGVQTKSAYFKVNNIPPVEELTVNYEDNLLIAMWNTPSCLPMNYLYVIVINITDNITISNGNITDQQYSVNVTDCNISYYTISVTIVDKNQLEYESMAAVKSVVIDYETGFIVDQIINEQMTVSFTDALNCTVLVPLKVEYLDTNSSCLADSQVILAVVTSISPSTNVYSQMSNITILNENNQEMVNHTFGPFDERFIGQLTIFPDTNASNEISTLFSTFNIQNFSITTHSLIRMLSLTCHYAVNSLADGCQVVFTSLKTFSVLNEFFILKSEESSTLNVSDVVEGNYTISIHDVVQGVKHDVPAYSINNYHVWYHNSLSSAIAMASTHMMSIMTSHHGLVYSSNESSLVNMNSTSINIMRNSTFNSSAAAISVPVVIAICGCVSLLICIIIAIGLVGVFTGVHVKKKKQSAKAEIEFITINSAYETVHPIIARFNTAQQVQSTINPAYDVIKIQQRES